MNGGGLSTKSGEATTSGAVQHGGLLCVDAGEGMLHQDPQPLLDKNRSNAR